MKPTGVAEGAPAKRSRAQPASYVDADAGRRRPSASDFVRPKAAEEVVSEAVALGVGAAVPAMRRIFDFTRAWLPPFAPAFPSPPLTRAPFSPPRTQ